MKIIRNSSGIMFPAVAVGDVLTDDGTFKPMPGGGDMLKADYDTDANGRVDQADQSDLRLITHRHTVTDGKTVTLAQTPAALLDVRVENGPICEIDLDFEVDGTTLSWDGLNLDGYLVPGDVLVIRYSYA